MPCISYPHISLVIFVILRFTVSTYILQFNSYSVVNNIVSQFIVSLHSSLFMRFTSMLLHGNLILKKLNSAYPGFYAFQFKESEGITVPASIWATSIFMKESHDLVHIREEASNYYLARSILQSHWTILHIFPRINKNAVEVQLWIESVTPYRLLFSTLHDIISYVCL